MKRAWFFVFFATCFFSSMEVALKGMVGHHPALQVNLTRFCAGGLFLLPIAAWQLKKRGVLPTIGDLIKLALLGFLGTIVSMSMYQLAVEIIPANVTAVLFCGNTYFVLLLSALLLHTKIHRLQWYAVGFSMLGMLFCIDPLHTELSPGGLVLAVLAPFVFAIYSVYCGKLCGRYGGLSVTCCTFLFGSLEMLFLVWLACIPAVNGFFVQMGLSFLTNIDFFGGYTETTIWLMLYAAIGVSGCGFACYFLAQEYGSPLLASLAFFVKPALAPILCWFFLGEHIEPHVIIGIIAIIVGSLLFIRDQLQVMSEVTSLAAKKR